MFETTMTRGKRLTIRFTEDEYEVLKLTAQGEDTTITNIIRMALSREFCGVSDCFRDEAIKQENQNDRETRECEEC